MRRFRDKLYKLAIRVHTFVNTGRVKAAGSLLYVACAVIAALVRTQYRLLERTLFQLPLIASIKTAVTIGIGNVGAILQHADTMFR